MSDGTVLPKGTVVTTNGNAMSARLPDGTKIKGNVDKLAQPQPQIGTTAKATAKTVDEVVDGGKAIETDVKISNVKAISADEANAPFIDEGWNPPHAITTQVRTFTTNEPITFARVFTESNPQGAFIVKADEIAGMTPAQIQQHLALPQVPTQIADVVVPAGTKMQVSKVAAQPDFGVPNTGGVQYQLLQRIPDGSFGIPRPLK